MRAGLESSLKQFLREVAHEVAIALMDELRVSSPQQLPTPASQDYSLLLTARDTAKRLAISERHLHGLTRSGQLPCVRVGKCVRYNLETVQKWVRETESTVQPSSTEQNKSKRALSQPKPGTEASRRKPGMMKHRKQPATRAKSAAPQSELPKVPQPKPMGRPQQIQNEGRISPFSVLLSELGIDRRDLPPITNGDLMRIAEVDIATMHGWLYLGRSLPEADLGRLKDHYRRLVKERKMEGDEQSS